MSLSDTMVEDIATKFNDAIRLIQSAAQFYADADEGEKRRIRHMLYQRTGNYGKWLVSQLPEIAKLNERFHPDA